MSKEVKKIENPFSNPHYPQRKTTDVSYLETRKNFSENLHDISMIENTNAFHRTKNCSHMKKILYQDPNQQKDQESCVQYLESAYSYKLSPWNRGKSYFDSKKQKLAPIQSRPNSTMCNFEDHAKKRKDALLHSSKSIRCPKQILPVDEIFTPSFSMKLLDEFDSKWGNL